MPPGSIVGLGSSTPAEWTKLFDGRTGGEVWARVRNRNWLHGRHRASLRPGPRSPLQFSIGGSKLEEAAAANPGAQGHQSSLECPPRYSRPVHLRGYHDSSSQPP